VPVDDPPDEFTAVSPSARESESRLEGSPTANGEETAPPYQPPGTYAPPGVPPAKRSVWPWILGLLLLLLLVIGGIGAGAWFYFQPLKYVTANTNTSNTNANVDRSDINSNSNNSNSGSPVGNQNVNDNSDASENAPPPADESVVLADLTNLEHEWTVANINADKQKLNRILADDYVGVSAEGKAQAKAEYLRTVTRDTTVQKWEFDDLKVNLKGDRATLTGILRLRIQDQDVMYRFVDKFVWRDGRWQATGSEVELVKQTAL
jgi:ketosteroid isomerase-like protein